MGVGGERYYVFGMGGADLGGLDRYGANSKMVSGFWIG